MIEAADTVQAQNDFIAAMTGSEQSQVGARPGGDTGQARQGPVRRQGRSAEGLSAGQATLIQAQNDLRSTQTALEAARNKLRILGFTDEAISTFQEKGSINPETTIYSPIDGTVVQRKIGPGQYVNSGASDPVS